MPNNITRSDLATRLEEIARKLRSGCGSSSCEISGRQGGQTTNGRCRCTPREINRDLDDLVGSLPAAGGWNFPTTKVCTCRHPITTMFESTCGACGRAIRAVL